MADAFDTITKRGFAGMDPARQRALASKGGKAAHEKGTAHEWDTKEARAAGRKGGVASKGGRGKSGGEVVAPVAPAGTVRTEPFFRSGE